MVRTSQTINEGWSFLNEGIAFGQNELLVEDESWEKVNVPHTWNAEDPFDAKKSYRRGVSWYRKIINVSIKNRDSKKIYLHFEGVNQVADVFVNGIHVGKHKGGYTAFTFDITKALNSSEEQLVAIMVNNAHDSYIAPLSVGFALYGGIYRDVWLIETGEVHFDMDNYGSKGVFITTPEVGTAYAKVIVNGTVVNEEITSQNIEVKSIIYDAANKEVKKVSTTVELEPGQKSTYKHEILVDNPNLWSPDSPYLYSVKSVVSEQGIIVDEIENPLGLRWFSFEPNKGFFLNGKHMKLRGTNRHQDKRGKGSALSNAEHRRDMQLIKDMGCNFIRIAHYPQDPEILKAADELGLLAWEEVPLVNYMTIHPEFLENSKHMLKEMIRQHYNHPSVVVWGSMNEIFLWGNNEARISKQDDPIYTNKVAEYAKMLDATIREEDPARYTTLAMHMGSDYDEVGIEDVPQVASYNVYSGWYGGKFADFGNAMDRKHEGKPDQVIFISEYGAGSDSRLNSDRPERFDFTGQYQRMFCESYLEQIEDRDYISGSAIWNQFDFSQPHVGGSMPHLNQKGMATWDRKPKDVYYLFQANWSAKPMLHIAEKNWAVRAITSDFKEYTITIYSNLPKVTLYANGKKIGSKNVGSLHKVEFNVVLHKDQNYLKAVGSAKGEIIEDTVSIEMQKQGDQQKPDMFINVGSNAQYYDDVSNIAWLEDSPFNGLYGYIGGKETLLNRKNILRSGRHDPLFYSLLEGLKSYKIKTKNGAYRLTLHFMESEELKAGDRVFDVIVNGKKIIAALDLVEEAGFCYGIDKTFDIDVNDNEILIEFVSLSGKTTLSGLELIKLN
ncbi:glycoside hydrolase family 2 TIM barrel-domain containing protein [Formosa haliotis]|uniref:glycoside hydrolase family 2 TIM barrel-domain containing protein n=1 Tax=Formosa haliotis TaxID=1555194 RepID=UPI0008258270|nr:glycoside hydrolase family 2 TIM barrel-domain containing protein [Formosa haliotis]